MMSDHTPNFPGNPYRDATAYTAGSDARAVAEAIQLLAFEVRTSNLIEAARPVSFEGMTESQRARSVAALREARERLGRPAPELDEPDPAGSSQEIVREIANEYKEGRA